MRKIYIDVRVYQVYANETGEIFGKYMSVFDAVIHFIYYSARYRKLLLIGAWEAPFIAEIEED